MEFSPTRSITDSTSLSIFKKKMNEFLMNWVWIDLAALPQLIYLPYKHDKPGGFLEVLAFT